MSELGYAAYGAKVEYESLIYLNIFAIFNNEDKYFLKKNMSQFIAHNSLPEDSQAQTKPFSHIKRGALFLFD